MAGPRPPRHHKTSGASTAVRGALADAAAGKKRKAEMEILTTDYG